MIFDPSDLSATPSSIPVRGEDPRALATDGSRIYGAIFEAGNLTTVLSEHVVKSSVNPYPGNQNPPPNAGSIFDPPLNRKRPAAPAAPPTTAPRTSIVTEWWGLRTLEPCSPPGRLEPISGQSLDSVRSVSRLAGTGRGSSFSGTSAVSTGSVSREPSPPLRGCRTCRSRLAAL